MKTYNVASIILVTLISNLTFAASRPTAIQEQQVELSALFASDDVNKEIQEQAGESGQVDVVTNHGHVYRVYLSNGKIVTAVGQWEKGNPNQGLPPQFNGFSVQK